MMDLSSPHSELDVTPIDAAVAALVASDDAKPRTSARWLRLFVALLLLAGGAAGAGWLYTTRPIAVPEEAAERVWAMHVHELYFAPAEVRVDALGTVRAGRTALLRPQVSGRHVEVGPRLLEGARVAANDLLLEIDDFDYNGAVSSAEAAVEEAAARREEMQADRRNEGRMQAKVREQIALRRRDVERNNTLRRAGNASAQAADAAAIALNTAEQSLQMSVERADRMAAREKQAEAAVAAAEVTLARARRDLEHVRLQAPFDGFVADVDAAIGKQVSPSDTVARLVAEDSLEAHFSLDHREFSYLLDAGGELAKRDAVVVWQVGESSFSYQATLDRVGAQFDAASGGVQLIARIGKPLDGDGQPTEVSAPLRPGAFVDIYLPGRSFASVARVPDSAVTSTNEVFRLVGEQGENATPRLEALDVTVLAREGESLLIRAADGSWLRDGTVIVRDVFPGVAPGIRVRVLEDGDND